MRQAHLRDAFANLLRSRGIKLTARRRAIAKIIIDAKDHPCVNEIHALVTAKHPRISLATVYRTVRVLRDAGFIEEHSFGEGRNHYELASGAHHDHPIDTTSGAIIEFCDPEIVKLQQRIAKRLGYDLVGHRLELYAVPRDDPAGVAPTGTANVPRPQARPVRP
jgi:Fur family ferric uptake transcriptional regulator